MSSLYNDYTPPTSGSGKYLKIEDGQTVKLRLVGYPVVFEKVFPGNDQPSTRYAWTVYNHDADEAQVFEQGITFFKTIQALAKDDEWGDPSRYDIKVSRTGTGTDTTYNVNPSPNKSVLMPPQLEKVGKIDLLGTYPGSISLESAVKGFPVPKADSVVTEIGDRPLTEDDLQDIPF